MATVTILPVRKSYEAHFQAALKPVSDKNVFILCTMTKEDQKKLIEDAATSLSRVVMGDRGKTGLVYRDSVRVLNAAFLKASKGYEEIGSHKAIVTEWEQDMKRLVTAMTTIAAAPAIR